MQPVSARLLKTTLAAGAAAGLYALAIEPRWLQVTRTDVPIPALPEPLDGLRIAVLSDFHVRDRSSVRLARRACDAAMRHAPDLIAVAGDLIDEGESFGPVAEMLQRLEAPLGVYAVPGNHDHTRSSAGFRTALRACPHVIDLTNEQRVVHVESARLAVVGVDDLESGNSDGDIAAVQPAPDVMVAIAHQPSHAPWLQQRFGHIDLLVSGHTHGGQIRLPLVGALVDPWGDDASRQGLQRIGGTPVYVSRGIGTTRLPVRLFCRPEVAVLELVRA